MKSIAKNSLLNISYKLLSIVFPLISSMYVSRILKPDGIGIVAYAQTIVSYFVLLSSGGMNAYCVREISKVRCNQKAKNKLFSELVISNITLSLMASVIYIILIFSVYRFKTDIYLYLVCGIQIIANAINIDWFYQGEEDYLYIVLRSTAVKITSLICIFVFVRNKDDYISYAFISSLALVGNYIFNVIHARKSVRFSINDHSIGKHIKPIIIFMIVAFLGSIYNKIDVTMMGLLSTDYSIGIYSNAHKIIDIVLSICVAITSVLLPRLSQNYRNNSDQLNSIVDKGFRALCYIVIPSACGVFILGPYIAQLLFGTEFFASGYTLRVFAPIIIIRSFGDLFCYQLLIASGNEKARVPANLLAMVVNILLNWVLIPKYHENGAAIASVLSELLVNSVLYIYVSRKTHLSLTFRSLYEAIVGSFIMAGIVYLFLLIKLPNIIQTLGAVVLGILVYMAVGALQKNEFVLYLKKFIRNGIKK